MEHDDDLIVGFDILPSHSPNSRTVAKFACVVVRNGVVLNEYSEISRNALLRMVRDLSPAWFCTDNIFEIVSDSQSLFRLVDRIPLETKLVQVTGVPPHQVSLKTLARRYGLQIRGKATPLQTATIAAMLVSRGVGYFVECFGEQTEIKVTRGRKPGRGGQSANRYRRRVHSAIQQMTRHIESELKDAKIDYDIHIRQSDFGYASARFVTNAPLPAIRSLIESKKTGDFKVMISPVRKRVEFLPLEPKSTPIEHKPRYFILGVDPGTTAAYCLLTLDGKVHSLRSKKGLTRADIIREVYEVGIPVVVASDVPTVPHFVEKLASTVSAMVFTPNKPIPVADKQELAREYASEIKTRNAHERDSLTAAVYAYRSVLPKLRQIDRMIREDGLSVDRNHLKALVLKGVPINEALASIEPEGLEVPDEEPLTEPAPIEELTQERFNILRAKNVELVSLNQQLEEKLEDLRRVVEFLRFRESELSHSLEIVKQANYWKVKRDREVVKAKSALKRAEKETARLQKKVQALQDRLNLLKGVKRLEMKGDMLALRVIPHFSRESIEEYATKNGLRPGDIVLFEDASGAGPQTAGILIEREIRAVVVDTPLSHLSREELVRAQIPVIKADDVELQRVDEFAFISRKKFETQLQVFTQKVREEARRKGEKELIELVERYRHESER
ncbi:MAG: DUF460 domain-containing protein [Candidatus Thorarchaeota archaeon]